MGIDAKDPTIAYYLESIEEALRREMGERLGCPDRLQAAMSYSVMAGGKRLRPLLVLLANEACRGVPAEALPAAVAVEMIHTYSLIHDDLPAMDNDDWRRGVPTCHRRFDEATAILAGDGLLTDAFVCLTRLATPRMTAACVRILATAAGSAGMVGGQMDDLTAADQPASFDTLRSIHERKTGCLLAACLEMGAVVADATVEKRQALVAYGKSIGLAFQIADDLLDVEGSASQVGKSTNKDEAAGKLTYPGLLGIEASREMARALADEAREHLRPLGPAAARLMRLAHYMVERDR